MTRVECQRLFGYWSDAQIEHITTPATGTINTIRILHSAELTRVLRIYRHHDRDKLEREHRVVAWANEKGIPVVPPLQTKDGRSYVEDEGRFVVLLPFVPDLQVTREALQQTQIEEMGRFLGSLHATLAAYPSNDIPPVNVEIDREGSLESIERLIAVVRSAPTEGADESIALERLITRRDWLLGRGDEDAEELGELRSQVVHGDYQESNLFFRDGRVSYIVDWDKIYQAPAAWEVVRAFDLMFRFEVEPCRSFLRAYREVRPLSQSELDVSARCYGLKRAYDLWLLEEIYEGGNDRLRRFLHPGPFQPIVDKWDDMRARLGSGATMSTDLFETH